VDAVTAVPGSRTPRSIALLLPRKAGDCDLHEVSIASLRIEDMHFG
jgi:hypothetical protein